jgi:hypothetical protein
MSVMTSRRPMRMRGSYAAAQLAALVATAAAIVVVLIGVAIVLYVFAPHTTGSAVTWIKHAGSWLTSPFHHLVNARGDRRIWLNWGIAAVIYLFAGGLIARLIRSSSRW